MAAATIQLNPGEEILRDETVSAFWTWPAFLLSLGLWTIWRRRHRMILTNQRLVVCRGITQVVEQSVPLSRIQDVKLSQRRLHAAWVTVSTAGGRAGTESLGPQRAELVDCLRGTLTVSHGQDLVGGLDPAAGGAIGATAAHNLLDMAS